MVSNKTEDCLVDRTEKIMTHKWTLRLAQTPTYKLTHRLTLMLAQNQSYKLTHTLAGDERDKGKCGGRCKDEMLKLLVAVVVVVVVVRTSFGNDGSRLNYGGVHTTLLLLNQRALATLGYAFVKSPFYSVCSIVWGYNGLKDESIVK